MKNADKTHCMRGHPFDALNTYWLPAGGRNCRICNRENRRRRRLAAKLARPVPTLRERLDERLAPCPDDGCECLLWLGTINPYGYGTISIDNRHRFVHRIAWALDNGPVPDGLQLDHVKARGCAHRHCANVAHLEPVTCRENLLRGDTITAACAAKTHCKHGHPFDEANTYRRQRGDRECRACHREQARRYKERRRLAPHRDADAA